MSDQDQVSAALKEAHTIAVLSHVNPEGDTLGSALGAFFVLREWGKEVQVFNAEPLPPRLLHLPGAREVRTTSRLPHPFDLCLVVDCGDAARTGGLLTDLPPGSVLVNVDHHQTNSRFGTLNWVDPTASSTGEMIYRLVASMGLAIPPEAATNLYAAILTDTGSFRFGNTSASCLEAAAALVRLGVNPPAVAEIFYGRQRPATLQLLGELLTRMEVTEGGAVAWMEIRQDHLRRRGVEMEETEGFINYPRSLAGVKVAVVFKEMGEGEVKVSLRSNDQVDVSRIASLFGGGGHRNASGCTVRGSLREVRDRVLGEIRGRVRGER